MKSDDDDRYIPCKTPLSSSAIRSNREEHPVDRFRNICRILVNHAKKNMDDTTAFLLASLVDETDQQSVKDYIDAGVDKEMALRQAVQEKAANVCKWLVDLGADPFLLLPSDNDNDKTDMHATWSPLQLAASLDDMTILRYFLEAWNKRCRASKNGADVEGDKINNDYSHGSGGKNNNNNADSPIHLLCRYQHVSLQVIKAFKANVSQPAAAAAIVTTTTRSTVGGDQYFTTTTTAPTRPLPFHLAVMSDANLEVVYYFC
jgi:hypothetical protein